MNSLIFSSIILFAGITSKEIKEFDRTLAEKEHSLVQLAKAVKEPSVLEAVSSFRKNCLMANSQFFTALFCRIAWPGQSMARW